MITLVAGTRPNFMKIAPVWRALRRRGIPTRIVHTGQHFDASMSDVFFRDLVLPDPDVRLDVGGGSHAEQTAAVLVGVERELIAHRPRALVVVGDVTSTMASALAASKIGVSVVHVEAGLRSRDWTMPEEINRVVTDQLSDLLLTPSNDATSNLLAEGIDSQRIVFVGNVMIDSLQHALAQTTDVVQRLALQEERYAVLTLHRPANVDDEASMNATIAAVKALSSRIVTVFPVHPRTAERIERLGVAGTLQRMARLRMIEPLGYADFVSLVRGATFAATDSGGIQEETTALGIPCLTMRETTERPVTVTEGTNTIVGTDVVRISREIDAILAGLGKRGRIPYGWDGSARERIADAIERFIAGTPPAKTAAKRT